jgi:MFS family permease
MDPQNGSRPFEFSSDMEAPPSVGHAEIPEVAAEHAPEQAEHHSLGIVHQLTLSVLWLGINAQSAALLPIVIPTQILLFVAPGAVGNAQQATFLGWFSASGAVVALIIPPIIGTLSDHTWHPLGRRHPYIVVGMALALLGAWMLAASPDVSIFAVGFLINQLGANAGIAAYQSLVPDLVGPNQRGAASGYLGLMTILGNIGSLALAAWLFSNVNLTSPSHTAIISGANAYYLVTGLALLLTVIITIFGVHERPLARTRHVSSPLGASTIMQQRAPQRVAHLGWLTTWIAPWVGPWRHRNFTWVFLTRCFVMLGLTLFLTFIEYYFATVAHVSNFIQATAIVALLALLGAVISSLVLGILSDRIGRVVVVGVATVCMAAPALGFTIAQGNIPLWPLGLVFGLGYGAYTSVDWALAIDALPDERAVGKDMGIWSAATTLPSILAPALGAAVIALAGSLGETAIGYRAVFALATVFLLLGAVCVSFIKEERLPRANTPSPNRPATRRRRLGVWRLAGRTGAGRARGFLRFWPFWEWLTLSLAPITPIPDAPHGVLGVRLTRYRGHPITLPDGTTIAKGDWVGELHFHNARVTELAAHSSPLTLLHMIGEDLGALAAWVEDNTQREPPGNAQPPANGRQPSIRNIKAIFGVTILSRPAPRLGFTRRDRPHTIHAWFERFFLRGLLAIYNPQGVARLTRGKRDSYAEEVWMSSAALLRRYG